MEIIFKALFGLQDGLLGRELGFFLPFSYGKHKAIPELPSLAEQRERS